MGFIGWVFYCQPWMKEEEAARIASLNRMDLELFDSLTSHLSQGDADTDAVLEQVQKYEPAYVPLKGGAGERCPRTPDPAALSPPPPPPRGSKQWAARGQDPSGYMEALLKYIHRYGYILYCPLTLWL